MRLGTNACLNDLEIRGTKEDILAFLQGLYGYTSIYNRYNKNQYIQNKKNEYKKKKYPTFNTYAKISETIELYGYNDFGDNYYIEKWGTLLDTLMYYSSTIDKEIEKISESKTDICLSKISFETFKMPPIKWLEACSISNPRVFFNLEYIDSNGNKGYKQIKKG